MNQSVITYTWCECGENHRDNQQIGTIADKGEGYTFMDLHYVMDYVDKTYDCSSLLIDLKELGLTDENDEPLIIKDRNNVTVEVNDAYFLIIKGLLPKILDKYGSSLDDLYSQVISKTWDTKYLDPNKYEDLVDANGNKIRDQQTGKIMKDKRQRGRVMNKHARSNHCISTYSQEANYRKGQGTIHTFHDISLMEKIRHEFAMFGNKFQFNVAEGNLYRDGGKKDNGIGWHGDSERRRVLMFRLGKSPSMPFYYRWSYQSKHIGKLMKFDIEPGDVMIMSEWAVGTEWKKSSLVTLLHATGASKFVTIK